MSCSTTVSRAVLLTCGTGVPHNSMECAKEEKKPSQKKPSQVLQAVLGIFLRRLCLDLKWPQSPQQRLPRAGVPGAASWPWGSGV